MFSVIKNTFKCHGRPASQFMDQQRVSYSISGQVIISVRLQDLGEQIMSTDQL